MLFQIAESFDNWTKVSWLPSTEAANTTYRGRVAVIVRTCLGVDKVSHSLFPVLESETLNRGETAG